MKAFLFVSAVFVGIMARTPQKLSVVPLLREGWRRGAALRLHHL
jgi:hypothetical protein